MALTMVSVTGFSQTVLGGSLQQISGSNRLNIVSSNQIKIAQPKLTVKAQQNVPAEPETSRRAVIGLAAAGLASGSLVQAVLAKNLKSSSVFDIAEGGKSGGWQPTDPKDPTIQALGEFAVTEHNKEAKTDLKFETVFNAYTQVVAGVNYRLGIKALDGFKGSRNYEAVVFEDLKGKKELTSFIPLLL